MESPLVCIVILNWNGGDTTLKCLKSLEKTKYKNYKTVVLDNGSSDDSLKKIRKKFKNIELITLSKNIGYTAGMNYLWNHCLKNYNPEYIINMNNDIVTIQSNWLTLMVDAIKRDPLAGICGNKLLFPDGRLQLLFLDRKPKSYSEKDIGKYDFKKEVTAVGGANMLIKTKLIKDIGGNDENYFYGPDDIDYCLRARKKGYKIVYQGLSKTEHLGSFSYNSSKKDFIYGHQSYGMILFALRHLGPLGGTKMAFRQFIRTLITRKDPFKKLSLKNIYFHRSFLNRIKLFYISLFKGIINYKTIKVGNYPELIKNEKTKYRMRAKNKKRIH